MLSHYLNRRRLGAYLDGALEEGTARSTAAHLATCGVCQREAEGLRRLRALLQRDAAVATTVPVAGLALVAPPMRVVDVQTPRGISGPIVVVAGAEDQYCPAPALERLRAMLPEATVIVIEGADHFFFGSLMPLGDAVGAWADALAAG